MNADKLFDKYAKEMTPEGNGYYLNRDAFIAALSEAMCCGHLQPVVSQSGGAGSKGGPKIIGVVELRAISALLKIIDDAVQRQVIDSRSAIADARLNCCEPFTYFDGVE